MTSTVDPEKYIADNQTELLSTQDLIIRPQLSTHVFPSACMGMKIMLNNEKRLGTSVFLGSPGGYRSMELYCAMDGIIYVMYKWCQEYTGVDYFTRDMMRAYFDFCQYEGIPDWKEPPHISEIIKNRTTNQEEEDN